MSAGVAIVALGLSLAFSVAAVLAGVRAMFGGDSVHWLSIAVICLSAAGLLRLVAT